mmetsp:Transcript_39752/g.64548  ORF Transcript_39752/g.64548 Transcript_39752/m.64548 type:complete len:2162 (-) Transcript_39752:464-6949(-)
MLAMFNDVPLQRAQILATTAWPFYVQDTGHLEFKDLKRALHDLYFKYYCNSVAAEHRIDLEDYLEDLLQHVCSVVILGDNGATMVHLPSHRGFVTPLPAKNKDALCKAGEPVPKTSDVPVGPGEMARGYAYCAAGDVVVMDGCAAFPEDRNIDDGYISDEEDLKFFRQSPPNRFLLLCPPGTNIGSELSEPLSAYYNCVDLDVGRRAVKELKAEGELGQTLRSSVKVQEEIGEDTQAALIRKYLTSEKDTSYKGYVMHNIPCYKAAFATEYLEQAGVPHNRPQWVIDLTPCNEKEWAYMKDEEENRLHQLQLVEQRLREAETVENRAKQEKEAIKEEKRRKKEERMRRQEEREAKAAAAAEAAEGEGDVEDAPAEAEPEPEPEPEPEEEEPQEAPVLDEEGNPIDPAELKAKEEALQKEREERRMLFDLADCLRKGVRELPQDWEKPEGVPLLKELMQRAKHCGTYLRLNPQQSPEALLTCITKAANLLYPSAQTVAPFWEMLAQPRAESVSDEQARMDEMEEKMNEKLKELQVQGNAFTSVWQRCCPVAYYEHSVIVEGSVWYTCVYRSRIYLTSSVHALEELCHNPHKYLDQPLDKIIPNCPILLLKQTDSVLNDNGIQEQAFTSQLCSRMQYRHVRFQEYWQTLVEEKEEEKRRIEEEERNRKAAEEERKRIDKERAAAEAKAKKDKKAPVKVQGKKGKAVQQQEEEEEPPKTEDAAPEGEEGGEAEDAEAAEAPPEAPPDTPEMKIAKIIQEKISAKIHKPNILVDALTFDEEGFAFLYENRLLPETVIIMNSAKQNAEGAEVEEEAEPEEAEEGDAAAAAAAEGKPFDRTNAKLYSKYIADLVAKFLLDPNEEDAAPEEEAAPEEGGEEEGEASPEGEAENKPVKKALPRQKFTLKQLPVLGLDTLRAVDRVVQSINPFREPVNLGEGEGETEEAEETDEIGEGWGIKPTPKSKLGWTRDYCPVSVASGVLRKGTKDLSAVFKGQTYFFKAEAELNSFKEAPYDFRPAVPPHIPPPRLWVLGVKGSGKTSLATELSTQYHIPIFHFERAFFDKCVWPEGKAETDGAPELFVTAKRILQEVDDFDALQQRKKDEELEKERRAKEKEARLAAGEEDEDEDEEDEAEDEPWEPEEEEAKKERLLKAYTSVAADILQHEPFQSQGYIMDGYPTTDEEEQMLLASNLYPERVLVVKISSEHFVRRIVDQEFKQRRLDRLRKIRDLKFLRLKKARKEKRKELKQWRRRNLAEDDEGGDDEGEDDEIEDDPEPIQKADVISDLEGQFDTENGVLEAVVAALEEQSLDVISIPGDKSKRTVMAKMLELVAPTLHHRQSLLETPYVVRYDSALRLLRDGKASLSSFGYKDSVKWAKQREGDTDCLAVRLLRKNPPPEPPEPEEAEEVDTPRTAERKRKFRIARKKFRRLEELKEKHIAEVKAEKAAAVEERRQAKEARAKAKADKEAKAAAAAEAGEEEEVEEEVEEEDPVGDDDEEEEADAGVEAEVVMEEEQIDTWQTQIEEEAEGWGADHEPGLEFEGDEANDQGWPFDGLREELEALAKEEEEQEEPEEEPSPEELEELARKEELEARKVRYREWPKVCVFRNRVYFFTSEGNQLQFLNNPWRYLIQPAPLEAQVPKIVVLPYARAPVLEKDKYTTWIPRSLAEQVAHNLQAVYVSEAQLLEDLRAHDVPSNVAAQLAEHFGWEDEFEEGAEEPQTPVTPLPAPKETAPLSMELLRDALTFRLMMCDAVSKGYVLDGIPQSQAEAHALAMAGMSPLKVVAEHDEAEWNEWDRTDAREPVARHYDFTYKNMYNLSARGKSEWECVYATLGVIDRSLRRHERRRYLQPSGAALSLFDTCCTPQELKEQKSTYDCYCPFNWIDSHRLLDVRNQDPELRYSGMYCNQIYRFASKEGIEGFLSNPVPYLEETDEHTLPRDLPRQLTAADAEQMQDSDFEYETFCPVVLYNTREKIGLQGKHDPVCIWGNPKCSVAYAAKFYRMANEDNLQEFMQQPWVYLQARLPEKVPLKKDLLKGIHMDTYMEHTIYEATVRAMLAVEEMKPLFPLLSAKESAIKYMAVFMKAHNHNNNSIRALKYRHNYERFQECCQLLDFFVSHQKAELEVLLDKTSEYSRKAALWDRIQSKNLDLQTFVSLNNPPNDSPTN